MGCIKKENTGWCSHSQCPFSEETEHGYECIDIIAGFCESGEGCLPKCQYYYEENDTRAKQAINDAL